MERASLAHFRCFLAEPAIAEMPIQAANAQSLIMTISAIFQSGTSRRWNFGILGLAQTPPSCRAPLWERKHAHATLTS